MVAPHHEELASRCDFLLKCRTPQFTRWNVFVPKDRSIDMPEN